MGVMMRDSDPWEKETEERGGKGTIRSGGKKAGLPFRKGKESSREKRGTEGRASWRGDRRGGLPDGKKRSAEICARERGGTQERGIASFGITMEKRDRE